MIDHLKPTDCPHEGGFDVANHPLASMAYHYTMMFGSHLSVAGGMVNALHEARRLKLDCVQVFTKNQRQWNAKPLEPAERDEWLTTLRAMEWENYGTDAPGCPNRVVSHNSYLINLASPDPELWNKSIAAQRDEIERCEALNIFLCVAHPGAHLGTPRKRGTLNDLHGVPNADELAGLDRIVSALNIIHRDLPGYRTVTCLETTVGAGTHLGYSFHHLAYIRGNVTESDRIRYCFDTCHVTAAGYDMTTPANAMAVLEEFGAVCGLGSAMAFHINDSVGKVGSRLDRHAHIGDGCCGSACFRTIVNHPDLSSVPLILETPKGLDDKGMDWDTVNIRRLKRMTKAPNHADNDLPAASPASHTRETKAKRRNVRIAGTR